MPSKSFRTNRVLCLVRDHRDRKENFRCYQSLLCYPLLPLHSGLIQLSKKETVKYTEKRKDILRLQLLIVCNYNFYLINLICTRSFKKVIYKEVLNKNNGNKAVMKTHLELQKVSL